MRQLFETYSRIPADEVVPHIRTVRKKLWDKRAYPCTGLLVFLVPWIRYYSGFADMVTRLQPSPTNPEPKILDVGTYISHDLRALRFAGVPMASLYGLDLVPFWDLGWELFNDKAKFDITAHLLQGDILDLSETSGAAQRLDGKMDVVWCSALLHQFPWAKQIAACKRLLRFSVGTGALIAGCQTGSKGEESTYDMQTITKGRATEGRTEDTKPFKHNASSMERMWKAVGEELGLELEVSAMCGGWKQYGCEETRCQFMGDDVGVLEFTVKVL